MHPWYVCGQCGGLRHAPRARDSSEGPRHCLTPMILLSAAQAEAARRISRQLRRRWVAEGMHVLPVVGGRRTEYRPAIWHREVAEASRQSAAEEQERQRRVEELLERLRQSPLYQCEYRLPLALALVAGGYANAELMDGKLILTRRNT